MIRVYIFLTAAVITYAQVPSLGFCPDYSPMSDFDLERFLGKWYEAERYFQISEVTSRCVVTDYAKADNGKIFASNEVTSRLTGIKRIIGGYLNLAGKGNEGKLNIKYTTSPIATESTLTILDTDYDNYAVVWSCSGLGPVHAESVWLMTRDRIPSDGVMQAAYGILDQFKISRTFFIKTDQAGCALAASDINAANGISSVSTVVEATASAPNQQKKPKVPENNLNKSNDIPKQVAEVIMTNPATKSDTPVEVLDKGKQVTKKQVIAEEISEVATSIDA